MSNIIWTVEGTIKEGNTDDLIALMKEMLVLVEQETGTLNYQWTLAEDKRSLHVYERYADEDATFTHLGTWAKFADRFVSFVDITGFTVFTDASPKIKGSGCRFEPCLYETYWGFYKVERSAIL